MPVATFVMGATAWTPLDHKGAAAGWASRRMLPVGDIHALDPQEATAQCTGEVMVPEPGSRPFTAWAAGSCPRCSEAISPRAPQVDL